MRAKHIATVTWQALDPEGHDQCRLEQTEDGWVLIGHASFHDEAGTVALDYTVQCDDAWTTRHVRLGGQYGAETVSITITHQDGQWSLNDKPQSDVTGALDIDLSFTPATNLMPLRRMGDGDLSVRAAWLHFPEARLTPLDQTYSQAGASGRVSYRAEQTGFRTELTVDPSGFVTLYPNLWVGEVTHAD